MQRTKFHGIDSGAVKKERERETTTSHWNCWSVENSFKILTWKISSFGLKGSICKKLILAQNVFKVQKGGNNRFFFLQHSTVTLHCFTKEHFFFAGERDFTCPCFAYVLWREHYWQKPAVTEFLGIRLYICRLDSYSFQKTIRQMKTFSWLLRYFFEIKSC